MSLAGNMNLVFDRKKKKLGAEIRIVEPQAYFPVFRDTIRLVHAAFGL